MRIRFIVCIAVWMCALAGCKQRPLRLEGEYLVAESVNLLIPKQPGWVQDTTVEGFDPTRGGLALRLMLQGGVSGSPRIDVVAEALHERPTVLEEFLTRNLQEMAQLESGGQIHITGVEQRRAWVGSKPAYRVHHSYTVGSGPSQLAVDQVSTFVVLDKRGVAVTAAGRVELFHPQSVAIETMMSDMHQRGDNGPPPSAPPGVAPIDLGKLGGKKRK
jgi:hypothetical protein